MNLEKKITDTYKGMLFSRCDDAGDVFYFSHADFEGLMAEPFEFIGQKGQTMRGSFYYYNEKSKDRLVIFDHGMGGGHRSYMREIECLTKHGYTVLAYDHTGCMESDGENTGGFSQSLADLDACICAVIKSGEYQCSDISVMGHSWGGFSTLNICAFHPELSHIVAISGFASVSRMLEQYFGGALLRKYIPSLYSMEKASNPGYADCDAISSLHRSRVKALIIHSKDDESVKGKYHFDRMMAALSDRPNTAFLSVDGKGHNPNYTKDAVRYKDKFFKKLTAARKKGKLTTPAAKESFKSSFDWYRMTEQDEIVWQAILEFLAK